MWKFVIRRISIKTLYATNKLHLSEYLCTPSGSVCPFYAIFLSPQKGAVAKWNRILLQPLPPFISMKAQSDGSDNFAASQATRANMDSLRSAVNNSLNCFNIGLPGTIASSVRMAYLNSESNALSAYITLSHIFYLLRIALHNNVQKIF